MSRFFKPYVWNTQKGFWDVPRHLMKDNSAFRDINNCYAFMERNGYSYSRKAPISKRYTILELFTDYASDKEFEGVEMEFID